jgi:hypothetical protein
MFQGDWKKKQINKNYSVITRITMLRGISEFPVDYFIEAKISRKKRMLK